MVSLVRVRAGLGLAVVVLALGLGVLGWRSCSHRDQAADHTDVDMDPWPDADAQARRRAVLAHLKRPPIPAPPDAQPLARGSRWRLVKPGLGEPPDPGDTVRVEVSIWKIDGTLAFSSYQLGGDAVFSLSSIPADIEAAFGQIRPGGIAQLWIPRDLVRAAAAEGRKPRVIPEDDVVIEYELVSFEKPPESRVISKTVIGAPTAGVPSTDVKFPPPDASGPPRTALAIDGGIRYVVARPGSGTRVKGPDTRVQMSVTVWQPKGLLVGRPVVSDMAVATTPQRAPGGLSKLVAALRAGDAVRVWLSASQAKQAFPDLGEHESICDVVVLSIGDQ